MSGEQREDGETKHEGHLVRHGGGLVRRLERALGREIGGGSTSVVLAGHGVGKTPFLIGVALDRLLSGRTVLHVGLDQSVTHVRDFYETLFTALADRAGLADPAAAHAEIDRHRDIRIYRARAFSAGKLSDAIKADAEAGIRPSTVVVDGLELDGFDRADLADLRAVAEETGVELWLTVGRSDEHLARVPEALGGAEAPADVVLALEPRDATIGLHALKGGAEAGARVLPLRLDAKTLLVVDD